MLLLFCFWRHTACFIEQRITFSSLPPMLFCYAFITYQSLSVVALAWILFKGLWVCFLFELVPTVRASFVRTTNRDWLIGCPDRGNLQYLFLGGLDAQFLLSRWRLLQFWGVWRCGLLQHLMVRKSWSFCYLLSSSSTHIARKEDPWVSTSFLSQAVLVAKLFPFQ